MNSLFSNVYCINLKEDKKKWTRSKSFLEENEISYKRFDGVKYRLQDKDLSKQERASAGNLLSHYALLIKAFENKDENVFIFEDDFKMVLPFKETFNILSKIERELPLDYDLFFLGTRIIKDPIFVGKEAPKVASFSENLYKIDCSLTTHAVLYSKKGIEKILKKLIIYDHESLLRYIKEYFSVDWFYAREIMPISDCYTPKTCLCSQHSGRSSTNDKFVEADKLIQESYKNIQ